KKIMHKNIEVSATCVRVPVLRGHSEAVTIHFKRDVDPLKAREALEKGKNLVVIDDPSKSEYPMPIMVVERDETFVGRIRKDIYRDNVLHLWVVADNLRVGAATNAVRIAQKWLEMEGE
ncbi:MAG: aspartate-semialdehyde dehydrogenase, partial [Epsilonproteobacteria bacterium]|nr:aspartate-semialdehyde dehydrogenase [Campylobacterota bacterium]